MDARYVPPPPMVMPVIYPKKQTGKKLFTDDDVAFCRANVGKLGVTVLAKRYGCSKSTMWSLCKGWTYRDLNGLYPPQR